MFLGGKFTILKFIGVVMIAVGGLMVATA